MEYSLYTLNKKANLTSLTSTNFINTLNLVGFEVDNIFLEKLTSNTFIVNKRLLIKIPANREDLLNENLLLQDLSVIFLFQIYKIWKNFKKNYSFLLKKKYNTSVLINHKVIKTEYLNCLAYKIDFTLRKKFFSPLWLQNKLKNSGLIPKNLLTDILNLVLLEFGSSFGLSFSKKVARDVPQNFKIETLQENETFTTINLQKILLPKGSLVLKNEVNDIVNVFATFNVFLENETLVKKEQNLLNDKNNFLKIDEIISLTFIFTKSFEDINVEKLSSIKSLLPFLEKSFVQNFRTSFQRILTLLEILAEVEFLNIYTTENHNLIIVPRKILKLNKKLFSQILNIEKHDIKIFEKAGLKLVAENENVLYFDILNVRTDLEREIDLIEEYSRFIGYKNFVEILPIKNIINTKKQLTSYEFIQTFFLNYGFNEVFTNSIQDKKFQKNQLEITNPLNQEFSCLRTSIFPSLFNLFEINLKLGVPNLNFFEIGRVFKRVNQKIIEQDKFTGIFQFKLLSNLSQSSNNWLIVKGFFEMFLSNFIDSNLQVEVVSKTNLYFHPTRSITIQLDNKILGTFGEINPRIGKFNSSKFTIYLFDFNLNQFKNYKMKKTIKVVKDYSKYPSIFKDLSFLIDKTANFSALKYDIQNLTKELKNLSFFDIYFANSSIKNKVNTALRLEFQSVTKTLTNEMIENDITRIKVEMKKLYDIEFRN